MYNTRIRGQNAGFAPYNLLLVCPGYLAYDSKFKEVYILNVKIMIGFKNVIEGLYGIK